MVSLIDTAFCMARVSEEQLSTFLGRHNIYLLLYWLLKNIVAALRGATAALTIRVRYRVINPLVCYGILLVGWHDNAPKMYIGSFYLCDNF